MAARCASCSYPLSISDSVACYECSSHFHIDCAQLVGFPYYELNSDPSRNTFHCSTCDLLPLPSRHYDSDSDSDDCGMPSRQLDYHLEGQGDFAKDFNEVKGSVQDISDLCKDMLREINDLKSINLTLRCCVENLRHDSVERDRAIDDLKFRIGLLEGKKVLVRFNTESCSDTDSNRLDLEKHKGKEAYADFGNEYSKVDEPDNLPATSAYDHPQQHDLKYVPQQKGDAENALAQNTEEIRILEECTSTDVWSTRSSYNEQSKPEHVRECVASDPKAEFSSAGSSTQEVKAVVNEYSKVDKQEGGVKDWTWKGDTAVELEKEGEESVEVEEDTGELEEDEAGPHDWDVLDEEIRAETSTKVDLKGSKDSQVQFWSSEKDMSGVEEEEEEDTEKLLEQEFVEELDSYKPLEDWESEDNETYEKRKDEQEDEIYMRGTSDTEEDETKSEIGEEIETGEASEAEDKVEESSPGDGEGEKLPEGVEGDVNAEVDVLPDGLARLEGEEHLDGEKRLEGEERLDGVEPRLEGETALDGEAGVEGESRLGGQSPVEGEVQPSEESYEPPPPPVPEHTAEDLWLYLKESVTSEHPSTVQEFLENLIGTLQQVPEEYLKPVIDANIKRATSPSVTDGEHLTTPDGIPLQKNEVSAESLECALRAEGESSLTAESETATTTGGPKIEGAQTEVSSEFLNPEDTSEAAEGSAAVEGALIGGFWLFWVICSTWSGT